MAASRRLTEVKTMAHISLHRLLTALSLILVGCFVSAGLLAETRRASQAGADLDRLIPREKWESAGLNKLTSPEQQALAGEITALLASTSPAQSAALPTKDKIQWRKLHRRMSKDEVRNLLGEPLRISVSRYCEAWGYIGSGSVTFDSKGRLDYWLEP